MQIFTWNDIADYLNTGIPHPYFEKGTGISVGSFDGLHLGHRALLECLVKNCKERNLSPGVISFKKPLPAIKHKEDYAGDVSTLNQRLEIFEELGIEFAIIIDFDESFATLLGTDFLNILINGCNMQFIAEGVDFRFGYKGATDVSALKYFAQQNNIGTAFVEQVIFNEGNSEEERVSSSCIRTMVQKGFFATVEQLLVRPYEIEIDVQKLEKEKDLYQINKKSITQVLPPDGVYTCKNEKGDNIRLKIKDDRLSLSEESSKIIFC